MLFTLDKPARCFGLSVDHVPLLWIKCQKFKYASFVVMGQSYAIIIILKIFLCSLASVVTVSIYLHEQREQAMPNNQTDIQGRTILELCEQRGANIESARIAISRMYKSKGIECSFDRYRAATQEEYDTIQGIKVTTLRKQPTVNKTGAAITFQNTGTITAKTHTKAAPVKKEWLTRDGILIFTVAAPTIASVHNMYRVSDTIMGNTIDALALTVVLSCTGLAMVYTGIRNWPGILLTSLVILYESFANTVRIYQGMWQNGNPSRFLGSVCDIFGSGSHYTAISLGVLIASIVALTQYIVFFQLKRG